MPRTHVIAIANRKGGVAKTTTAINLGAALTDRGRRVLLVDLDVQQSLCSALQVAVPRVGLGDALLSAALFGAGDLHDVLVEAHGMTVAGGYRMDSLERELVFHDHWQRALSRALDPHLPTFDYVLLDCAPSLLSLTVSALAAADDVLVPIQTEFLAESQLPSVMSAVDEARSQLNPRLKVAGFLPTMYSERSRHALAVMERIAHQAHMWGVRAFKPIPRAVRLAEAAEAGVPITSFAPDSRPARAYAALADELERGRADARIEPASEKLLSPTYA